MPYLFTFDYEHIISDDMHQFDFADALQDGDSVDVKIFGKVLHICAYQSDLADTTITHKLIPATQQFTTLFSYDIKIQTEHGIIKVKLNPLLSNIQRGGLFENQFIQAMWVDTPSSFTYFLVLIVIHL